MSVNTMAFLDTSTVGLIEAGEEDSIVATLIDLSNFDPNGNYIYIDGAMGGTGVSTYGGGIGDIGASAALFEFGILFVVLLVAVGVVAACSLLVSSLRGE